MCIESRKENGSRFIFLQEFHDFLAFSLVGEQKKEGLSQGIISVRSTTD